jgi:hypothetical protein
MGSETPVQPSGVGGKTPTQEEVEYTYKWDYRNTRMGGMTKAVAICLKCREVIEPSRIERSKSGTHGRDYYSHQHQLTFIIIGQTNSGRRYVLVNVEPESELKNLLLLVKTKWVFTNASLEDIIALIKKWLKYC